MCCGKVNVIYKGLNIKGYVLDDDGKTFKVRLVNNLQINVNKPMIYKVLIWVSNPFKYRYCTINSHEDIG